MTEVETFDAFHRKLRNVEMEHASILEWLSIQKHHSVIDFGADTGVFAIQAAAHARMVYAVDVSQAMLVYAKEKATKKGMSNIAFCHGGFLTYQYASDPVDCIVSSLALHHLPDFWKDVAL